MPGKRRTKSETESDRAKIARYLLKGYEQQEIAAKMGLSESTISRDVKAIRKEWKESALMDFNEARNRELAALNLIERENWRAWMKSKRKDVVTTLSGGEGMNTHASTTERERYGDDRYMKIIMWCHEQRAKLMGLVITRHEHTGKDGKPIAMAHTVKEMTDAELMKIIQGDNATGSQ